MLQPLDTRCNPKMAGQTVSETPTSIPPPFLRGDRVPRSGNRSNGAERAITHVKAGVENGFLSSIFLVPKKDGGHRPIINLKRLNNFIPHHHFKMEGIHMLKDLLRQGDLMAKIDLKDAYFAVPISELDRKYLRGRETYQFNCLPFGLSCAPWVFMVTGLYGDRSLPR